MPSTFSTLRYHFNFATKNREAMILKPWRERLYAYIGGCAREAGAVLLSIGGTADHVHMLVALKPTHCVADVLRDLKRASSLWVHEEIHERGFAWQEGYGAFTVSPTQVSDVKKYIERQEEHHRTKTFLEEYREFLRRYEIEFDEKYL